MAVAVVGCRSPVQTGLSEDEANSVIVALHRVDIGAEKRRQEGFSETPQYEVLVADDALGEALGVLSAQKLPARTEPGLREVFGGGGLVPTATEERARYTAALGGELSRSIAGMDGVLTARVHVALGDRRDFALDEAPPAPRASVLVEHLRDGPPIDEGAVRALVAGAVQGMPAENVAVVAVAVAPPAEPSSTLVQVGPISVTRGSAATLKALLGAGLLLHLLLAGLLVFMMLRVRSRQTLEATAE